MENKSLHILIVASWYPSKEEPTSGSFIEEQAIMLKDQGHKVTVLHPYLKGTFLNTLFDRKTEAKHSILNGIQIIHVSVSPFLPGFRKLAYKKCYNQSIKALKSVILKDGSFDIVHSHALFLGGYVANKLTYILGLRHFHTEHTSGLIFQPEQYDSTDKRIIKNVFETAHRVFFVSEYAKNETIKQWGVNTKENHQVVHNIVENSFFQIPLEKIEITPFRYILIGSLIPIKGISLLIDAWQILIQEFPNSMLTIAGDGFLKEELEAQIRNIKLDASISFIPRLSREEVKTQLSKHHVLVSSSQLETFGLTVAEAQAMGKPVVVTDSGGVRDIVLKTTGIITRHSPADIAIGLIEIQKKFIQYDSDEIRKLTLNRFSSDIIYQKLYKIYSED